MAEEQSCLRRHRRPEKGRGSSTPPTLQMGEAFQFGSMIKTLIYGNSRRAKRRADTSQPAAAETDLIVTGALSAFFDQDR
jgi:hypothetical protein